MSVPFIIFIFTTTCTIIIMLGKSRRKTGVLLATATALAAGQTLANTSTALGVTVTGTTSNLATGATSTALAATENAAALNITVVGRKVLVVVVVLGYSSMTTNVGLSSIPVRIIVAICTIPYSFQPAKRFDWIKNARRRQMTYVY